MLEVIRLFFIRALVPFLFFPLFANASGAANTNGVAITNGGIINLPYYSVNLTYPAPVRLNQVLTDTNNIAFLRQSPAIYWLGAQLLEPAKNETVDILKSTLLEKLGFLSKYHPESTFKSDVLISLINRNNFSYRHFISLDNDLVRIQSHLDPMLNGRYRLVTPPRSSYVFFIGATKPIEPVKFSSHQTLDKYLESIALPKNSNTETLFIIQPDGEVQEITNSYWNSQRVFLTPGAFVFIGFKDLPERSFSLNKQIAELLRYMEPLREGHQP